MAYVVPMLVHIGAQPELKPEEGPVGLVLLPCQELCTQVQDNINTFAARTRLICKSVCGGAGVEAQCRDLLGRVDIVVATPGRILDLLQSERLNFRRVTQVVIDEADQMVENNFLKQVNEIMT